MKPVIFISVQKAVIDMTELFCISLVSCPQQQSTFLYKLTHLLHHHIFHCICDIPVLIQTMPMKSMYLSHYLLLVLDDIVLFSHYACILTPGCYQALAFSQMHVLFSLLTSYPEIPVLSLHNVHLITFHWLILNLVWSLYFHAFPSGPASNLLSLEILVEVCYCACLAYPTYSC